MTDDAIRDEWSRIRWMYRRGGSLRQRLALMLADKLEAAGVTDADIDRLFQTRLSPTPNPINTGAGA